VDAAGLPGRCFSDPHYATKDSYDVREQEIMGVSGVEVVKIAPTATKLPVVDVEMMRR